ncbi:unnamed protein product, partial [Linum tenue]
WTHRRPSQVLCSSQLTRVHFQLCIRTLSQGRTEISKDNHEDGTLRLEAGEDEHSLSIRRFLFSPMEDAYARSVPEVLDFFGVEPSKGLTDSQVALHAKIYGRNELPEESRNSFLEIGSETV